MACTDYQDKGSCNSDPGCEWTGKGKAASCQDAPPQVSCDGLNEADCGDAAACRWSNKDNTCLTR